MEETDKKIQAYSGCPDRAAVLDRLTELMGLRGHLQDELLRIQTMLTDDDPELKVLYVCCDNKKKQT